MRLAFAPHWYCRFTVVVALATIAATAHLSATIPQDSTMGLPEGIVWYGCLDDGFAEAKKTGKPILLMSAAPNCVGVSGIW